MKQSELTPSFNADSSDSNVDCSVVGRNSQKSHQSSINCFAHQMTITVKVRSVLMKYRIRAYVESTLAVTIEHRNPRRMLQQTTQKERNPLKFTCDKI